MITVESLSRKKIQSIRNLKKRQERYDRGLFIVEGARAVEQAIGNGVLEVKSVIMEETIRNRPGSFELLKAWIGNRPDIMIYSVSAPVFRQLSDTETTQGVMAVCRIPPPVTEREILDKKGVLLAADRIQDPGNMGTMIRTAVWFGACGLVVSPGTVDLFHPKVARSTAGATGVLSWLETDLPIFFDRALDAGWQVHLLEAAPDAVSYHDAVVSGKDIIVVGNEAGGISGHIKKVGHSKLRIDPGKVEDRNIAGRSRSQSDLPGSTSGKNYTHTSSTGTAVESLNVSVAAAIVIAHFFSQ